MMLFITKQIFGLARFYGKSKLETTTQTEKQTCLLFLRYFNSERSVLTFKHLNTWYIEIWPICIVMEFDIFEMF